MHLFRYKTDQSEDNTTEIKHRFSKTRKTINILTIFRGTKILLKT